jgi:chromosome segregation ATPase
LDQNPAASADFLSQQNGKEDARPAAADESLSFSDLQSAFQRVISDLVNDPLLDCFRFEYERLRQAFRQSHQSNEGLIARCRSQNDEISVNSAKVGAALKYSEAAQRTIIALRQEFEKVSRTVASSQSREQSSREIIAALRAELEHVLQLARGGSLFGESLAGGANLGPDDVRRLRKEAIAQSAQRSAIAREIDKAKAEDTELSQALEVDGATAAQLEGEIGRSGAGLVELDRISREYCDELTGEKGAMQKFELGASELADEIEGCRSRLDAVKLEVFEYDASSMH